MESYHGLILTPRDAIILLEAARTGMIPKTTRRLSEFERANLITNGAIFIWDERESGMKRWTDGKSWSASRVSGSFLIYKEMENTKNFSFYPNPNDALANINEESYRYKTNGLIKQSFSITLNNNAKLHLISYINHSYLKKNFNQMQLARQQQQIPRHELLSRPTQDAVFKNLKFDSDLYPDSILSYLDTVTDFQQVDSTLKTENAPIYANNSNIGNNPMKQPKNENYRIQSVITNHDHHIASPRRLLSIPSSQLPPLLSSYQPSRRSIDESSQQAQMSSLALLLQQQQRAPVTNTNIPIHHKEDGQYLSLLDRAFSS